MQEDSFRGDGLNLYTYVANNPIKYIDPTGHCKEGINFSCTNGNVLNSIFNDTLENIPGLDWTLDCFEKIGIIDDIDGINGELIVKNTVKSFAKGIMPLIKNAQDILEDIDYTKTIGICISGSPSIWYFGYSLGISFDTKGNVAVQQTVAGGVTTGTPGVSATLFQMNTNAPNVDKLLGQGYQVGGSIGVPVYGVPLTAAGEFNIIPDVEEGGTYYGTTRAVGLGTPGEEVHVGWEKTMPVRVKMGKTKIPLEFNIFDAMDDIYNNIMKW